MDLPDGKRPARTSQPVASAAPLAANTAARSPKPWERSIGPPLPEGFEELNNFAEVGAVAEAHAVLRRIQQKVPARLKRMLFNTAIKACAKASECKVADLYFQAMLQERIVPSERTFGKLIHTATWAGRLDYAERWLAAMEAAGFNPSSLHLNAMVQVAASSRSDSAEVYVERLLALGGELDSRSVSALVKAALQRGDTEKAQYWFDRGME